MFEAVPRRTLVVAAAIFAACLGVAWLSRWVLAERYPLKGGEWWRPAESAPVIDPETLRHAEQKRLALHAELAERRGRVRPIPQGLKDGSAVVQLGHAGSVSAVGWYGRDVLTAGTDATLRVWRPAPDRPRLLFAIPLPGVADALAGDPVARRLWAAIGSGLLVIRAGDSFETENRRHLPGGFLVRGLALADGGTRAVLLAVGGESGSEPRAPRVELRHFLAPDGLPLKSVPVATSGPVLAAALSPDGERVGLLVVGSPLPTLELHRTDDGSLLSASTLALPGWDAAAPWTPRSTRLALGPDFVAVGGDGGTWAWALAADGSLVPDPAWSVPADSRSDGASLVACAGTVATVDRVDGRGWLVTRGTSGWTRAAIDAVVPAAAPGGSDAQAPPARVACVDGAHVVVAARESGVDGIRILSPDGDGRVAAAPALADPAVSPDGNVVRLEPVAPWLTGDAMFSLLERHKPDGSTSYGEPDPVRPAEVHLDTMTLERLAPREWACAVDPSNGDSIVLRDGAFWSGPGDHPQRVASEERAECLALRGGTLALVHQGDLELLSATTGDLVGSWRLPEWLGSELSRVSLSRDGRSAAATTSHGFVVYQAGVVEPVLYYPAEGYFDAPAEFLPGGGRVALGRDDGVIEIWSLAEGEVDREVTGFGAVAGRPTVLWASDDGEAIFAGGSRGAVAAWRLRTGNQLWGKFPFDGPVSTVVAAPRTPWVLVSDRRTSSLLDRKSGDVLLTFAIDRDGNWLAATPDGYHVSSGPAGETLLALRLWGGELRPTDAVPFRMVAAGDPDFASLGNAFDALRVTLIGAGEEEGGGER
ncbi:MAG: WD40 repeat domain-containing protein [Deltaproteobacteria bacterium]|nr:WD40 repeat domain-containing protein [Deltaproteobacteria bacterium]